MEEYATFYQITHNSVNVHHTLKDLTAAKRKVPALSMDAKTMQNVFLWVTMIISAIVHMDSKAQNVKTLTNVSNVKLIHVRIEGSAYVREKNVTSADVLKVLEVTDVVFQHHYL